MRYLLLLLLSAAAATSYAQSGGKGLLDDINGDARISVLAFGDSITQGVGDEDGLGYPARLEKIIGNSVENAGLAGEELCAGGIFRYPNVFTRSNPDIDIIMEGANDAYVRVDDDLYQKCLQRLINITLYSGRTPVLMTLPTPCCEHRGSGQITPGYSAVIRALASMNNVPFVDLERVWNTTCADKGECELYNLPSGLHPNALGYTAIAQAVAATLYGIDIFAAGGAAELEKRAGLPAGSVIVKPDVTEVKGGSL